MEKIALILSKKFKISLPVPPLQKGVILVRGGNGSGKTTLLRVLASKFDISLNHFTPRHSETYLHNSCIFFEETTLSHAETLAKNLKYVNTILSTDVKKQERYIEKLHLTKVMGRKFKACSTGEKKKFLSILNLTQTKKSIYYLDEPFENIDEKSKATLLGIIKEEFSNDKSLYLTTHSPEVVKGLDYEDFYIPD